MPTQPNDLPHSSDLLIARRRRIKAAATTAAIGLIALAFESCALVPIPSASVPTPSADPTKTPLSSAEKAQIEIHNNATLHRAQEYALNPAKYDAQATSFMYCPDVQNGKAIPDGATKAFALDPSAGYFFTSEITGENRPPLVYLYGRVIGVILTSDTAKPEYVVFGVGQGKVLVLLEPLTTHPLYIIGDIGDGSGDTCGENVGSCSHGVDASHPNGYTNDELTALFGGNTDSKGNPVSPVGNIDTTGMPASMLFADHTLTSNPANGEIVLGIVNAVHGKGTSPNVVNFEQLQAIVDGAMPESLLPRMVQFSNAWIPKFPYGLALA